MKKILFLGLVFSTVAFASCSKTYTCTVNGVESDEISSDDYTDEQIDQYEAACKLVGGEWSSK